MHGSIERLKAAPKIYKGLFRSLNKIRRVSFVSLQSKFFVLIWVRNQIEDRKVGLRHDVILTLRAGLPEKLSAFDKYIKTLVFLAVSEGCT